MGIKNIELLSGEKVAFLVTKPIQLVTALTILDQIGVKENFYILMTRSFSGCDGIFESIISNNSVIDKNNIEIFSSCMAAYNFSIIKNIDYLFLDSDVGFVNFLRILKFKIFNINSTVLVYEEGVGSYRTDIYGGLKKNLFNALGIGTSFGGSLFVDGIFVYDTENYKDKFPRYKKNIYLIIKKPMDAIYKNIDYFHDIFSYGSMLKSFRKTSKKCYLYLSSWNISKKFINSMPKMDGDKYVKIHPHIEESYSFPFAHMVDRSAPAELVIADLMNMYDSIIVYHHGSTVERYVENDRVEFRRVDDEPGI